MKSSIVKRSVVIGGHKTSVSLEEPFWTDLKQIAHAQHVTLSELVAEIDGTREQGNLSSAIRLFVLHHFRRLLPAVPMQRSPARQAPAQDGHSNAAGEHGGGFSTVLI